MNFEVKVPDISTTGDSVVLTRWLIEAGQPVKRGQALVEVETDKATTEVESAAAGTLKELKAGAGDKVAVGQVIAIIEKTDTGAPAKPAKVPTAESAPEPVAVPKEQPAAKPAKAGGMFAKNRQARDAQQAGPEAISLSPTQRVVGKRMLQSKQTAPHFYLQTSLNAEPMVKKRQAAADTGKKLAWDAFFVKAVSQALKKFDRMSYRIENDRLIPHGAGAVGVAVSIDEALYVVPITITNLGVANVEVFTPIINPPESSILSIGKTKPQAVVVDGKVAVQNRVSIVLSVDHRVINGKYAADFLTCIVEKMEKD